ncbi:MAG: HAD hydrolase-like protein [Candidatus Diapherotrites archaeon]|jgi:phosphoglycolate phosphatase|uniref:HAD hydrolase-like protein n=1 Tax=Candidatus Iainarchaeum sp. TaxID=3101447 RepID=A0A8T5GEH8_9ARCH|nr:HAD hydrolase-like protein [Candidatus Diapherotrites archaeon]MBT7240919.1 HAD hydrolase-like protein [Candidatus Diapherotrites archaeon]
MKAIVFDVDGVLVDSLEPHVEFCRDMNKQFKLGLNLPKPGEGKLVAATPMDNFLRRAGFPEKVIPEIMDIYTKQFSKKYFPKPFPGVPELLLALKKEGFSLAIATSNFKANVKQALGKSFGLFDAVYAKDVHASKVDAVNDFVKKRGLKKSEVLFVGDTKSDRSSAKKAGVKFIGVTYGWQLEKEKGRAHMHTVQGLLTRLVREKKVVEARRRRVVTKKVVKKKIKRRK